jgi:hypothetical protein
MEWYWQVLITSSLTALFILVVLAGFQAATPPSTSITVDLQDAEQVNGGAVLSCQSIGFRVHQFSITDRTGLATIDNANCVIVKKTV